ncbi:MAG: TrkA C-terminal domain-containing protein [Candidatus Thermoplasmatota archaeon]|nr:TrkA C-terminal domain-containing protein [Candidatus Thermoplasmatota archaeon]
MGKLQEVTDPVKRVEEIFLEMKDTSELMVDLAYSSLLYDNKEIATEVEHLGDIVDEMSGELRRIAVGEVSQKSPDAAMMILRMVGFVDAIADSAMSIGEVVLRDIEPHPILKQSIKEADTGIYKTDIRGKSILAGKKLGDLRLATETGMWVFAIKRKVRWIYGPEKDRVLEKGDVIFARGPEDGMKKLRAVARGKMKSLE